jgi:hypothetical protein
MQTVIAIKHKLCHPEKKSECIADIERIVDVKQAHLWRADSLSPCCGGTICNLAAQFQAEIEILGDVLNGLKGGHNSKAATLLEEYLAFLQKSYKSETSVIEGLGFSENKQRQLSKGLRCCPLLSAAGGKIPTSTL